MRVSTLRLEHWRNFPRAAVALQQRNFLVGPNASGKSNFLDALRFLRDLARVGGGFEKAVADRGGLSRLRTLGAARQAAIVLDARIENGKRDSWRYRLAFVEKQRRPEIAEEVVWRNEEVILRRPDAKDDRDRDQLRQTHLQQLTVNVAFRPVAEFFASIRYYHIVPQLVREPARWQGGDAEPFGSDLVERVLRTATRTRDARLRRIERAIAVAVPQLHGLRVDRDERGIAHLYGRWRSDDAWQTEVEFSDGTLRLLGLLWSLLDGTGPLLLEEPELSLHPEIVRYIPQLMARVAGRSSRQVLASTHGMELLSDRGIAPDEVLLFRPEGDGTNVVVGADLDEVRQLLDSGLPLSETILPLTRPQSADQLGIVLDQR